MYTKMMNKTAEMIKNIREREIIAIAKKIERMLKREIEKRKMIERIKIK